jgi:hypothetical protein
MSAAKPRRATKAPPRVVNMSILSLVRSVCAAPLKTDLMSLQHFFPRTLQIGVSRTSMNL